MPWAQFARECGFISVDFQHRYDFALSFAGQQRELASALFDAFSEHDVEVFYDKNEQHRILATNVEEYLRPIYQSEARFVVPLLSREYPERIWARIESDAFRQRFEDDAVIPVWFSDTPPGMFDESRKYGGLTYQVDRDLSLQVADMAGLLIGKLKEIRGKRLA